MNKIFLGILVYWLTCGAGAGAGAGTKAEQEVQPPHNQWSFESPLGTFDRGALQRGFQVYQEVCYLSCA